jgi:hypothetical protein
VHHTGAVVVDFVVLGLEPGFGFFLLCLGHMLNCCAEGYNERRRVKVIGVGGRRTKVSEKTQDRS